MLLKNGLKGIYYLFFLARIGKITWDKKRYARGKLGRVKEEKNEKSYKLKVWHRIQIHYFSTFKDGRLTSTLGLKKLFVFKGFLVKKFVLQKKIYNSKKNFKKRLFHKKKFLLNVNLKKCCESKKMHEGHMSGRRKNFYQKKSKLKVWHSYRKK